MKMFKIDYNQLTGLENFTQISKNPLAIPPHGVAIDTGLQNNNQNSKPALTSNKTPTSNLTTP